ncbi:MULTISPECIES: Lsr2 family protein [unclassified Amycolatopsis]|uniref:histone-like nucleoid-structuring protein Lsr2 n=1 Tax=unclassified Amycolatopsis TaxID=2618356 RepID=UPI002874FFBF|nr:MULTISPECIES: Lsr2 family protein [unclassified Amycolatopsis]MDS0140059.1 Lsr2 family protein [Amycolatopsis sp. 505]MDS0146922.1 Lsr2 family protein [Amycolatopsis sp. CM201R]
MAQKVSVEILDDIDGSAAAQTVQFSLDGVTFEIDLSDRNAAALRDELARYIGAGRRVGGRKVRVATGQSTTAADRERNQRIRAWANANGFDVSERGRLSSEVVAAFERVHGEDAESPVPSPRKRAPRRKAAA